MKYILVYNVKDYPEMGGGIHFEEFKNELELEKRVEEIFNDHQIIIAGEIEPYYYKAVEKVVKIERDYD